MTVGCRSTRIEDWEVDLPAHGDQGVVQHPPSGLCERHGLQPGQFYLWQKTFIANGAAAFAINGRHAKKAESHQQQRIECLEAKLRKKDEGPRRAHGRTRPLKKRTWGTLTGKWIPHDTRDQVVDFVRTWSDKTQIPRHRLVGWLGIAKSKFHDWQQRHRKDNEHTAWLPRDHWLEPQERQAILYFQAQYPLEGYRRLAFMLLDRDLVAASPASVHRVLQKAGRLSRRKTTPSQKGRGFQQPLQPHEHWHVDVSYLNIAGTFYFLCSVLDGCSRAIVHWEIRETMKEPKWKPSCSAPASATRCHSSDHLRQRAAIHRPRL